MTFGFSPRNPRFSESGPTYNRVPTWQRVSSKFLVIRPLSDNPMYKVVGIVKRHFRFRESGAESRALREAGVYRQTLDAADGSPPFLQTKRSFVLFRIPFPLSTKARSFEIPRGI